MIKISQDKDKLLKSLAELEADFEEGKISRREYQSLKREYTQELETLNVADRIRRMQGRGTEEKPLDHWVTKSKVEKDKKEEEELVNKFVRKPIPLKTRVKTQKKGYSKFSIIAIVFLAVAFFVGTGFGVYMLNSPTDTSNGPVIVNDTAFPLVNNATIVNNDTTDTKKEDTTDKKTTTTKNSTKDTNNNDNTDKTDNTDNTNDRDTPKTDDNTKTNTNT